MIEVVPAQSGEALEHVIALSRTYVAWMADEIRMRYPDLDIGEFAAEHDYDDVRRKFPGEHTPSRGGCLLLARSGEEVCGCVALGRLTEAIGEMRTLYVRPPFRGAGIGRRLAEASLDEARKFGYRYVRLDTLDFMESALGLYRSLGFYNIAPYRELSTSLRRHICFLERDLAG